jgi:hypothetical protein
MTAGICRFCGITDAEVDGERVRWFTDGRTCCDKYECRRKHLDDLRRRKSPLRRPGRTSADIHALKQKEAAAKRQRYREAAKARNLLREKGDRG